MSPCGGAQQFMDNTKTQIPTKLQAIQLNQTV
uniref:Uncharacterized protein n=1 Tax=Nelumbo nucifera TaxID=4432 RepID=A0A822XGM9_NELNU|nr:TPA_asm: hypothetical protein HUJ06_019724 [Nelumbo nucifera]